MNFVALDEIRIIEDVDLTFDCLKFKAAHKIEEFISERTVAVSIRLVNGSLEHVRFNDVSENFFSRYPVARLICQAEILEFLNSYKSKGKS